MATSPFDWMHVGHWTDVDAKTGCSVVRFVGDVVASGEVRGGAPATREFALLDPTRMVQGINAVCLSGGSAFGLAAADGVARSLRRDDVGFATTHGLIPIVVAMSLYDLGVGSAVRWPGAPEGSSALEAASVEFEIGLVGAGAGATVGKWRGADAVRPGGIGFAAVSRDEVTVSALVAVNAVGDVADDAESTTADIAAGAFEWPDAPAPLGENTTIGVVATNAKITKTQCRSLAEAGHDGLARAIVPAHGPADGDAIVAVAKPEIESDLATLRLLTTSAVEQAVRISVAPVESIDTAP